MTSEEDNNSVDTGINTHELESDLRKENYDECTREELIQKIQKLKCHVKQLRNVIRRDNQTHQDGHRPFKQARKNRPFDFSKHPKRHVALKIAYLGYDYQGLAVQEDTDKTIESYLFDALTKSKLIAERSTSNYHRCGRTDKGVSAFGQVISIDLRCKSTEGHGVILSHCDESIQNGRKHGNVEDEIEYCRILNALLPKQIRVIAWAPVKPDFSARFDCTSRTYKYYVPIGNMDIGAIIEAGSYLIGEHNYQNFCKVDNSAEKTTIRKILAFNIKHSDEVEHSPYGLCEIEIRGQSFLWHQIRCIVAILVLVGQGKEKPDVVKNLLDLTRTPKKPQYNMAVDYPLVLFATSHGSEISEWICSPENYSYVAADLQTIWAQHSLKARMTLEMLKSLESALANSNDEVQNVSSSFDLSQGAADIVKPKNRWILQQPTSTLSTAATKPTYNQLDCLVMGTKTKVYKSLIDRPVCGNSA